MTQEDKELLIKDICTRLPYGVRVNIKTKKSSYIATVCEITRNYICIEGGGEMFFSHGTYKPYLRPMSSMTEEETKEYHKILITSQDCSFENSESATTMVNDWLLSKHFDVRGLILKGLAIEVTEDNNPYKE